MLGSHFNSTHSALREIKDGMVKLTGLVTKGFANMATKAQLDQLTTDVAALIEAGVAEITAAVAAAQKDSPDPAIDALDAKVTAATKALTDAANQLKNPPA